MKRRWARSWLRCLHPVQRQQGSLRPELLHRMRRTLPVVSSALQELGRVTDEANELTPGERSSQTGVPRVDEEYGQDTRGGGDIKGLFQKASTPAMAIVRTVLVNVMTAIRKSQAPPSSTTINAPAFISLITTVRIGWFSNSEIKFSRFRFTLNRCVGTLVQVR